MAGLGKALGDVDMLGQKKPMRVRDRPWAEGRRHHAARWTTSDPERYRSDAAAASPPGLAAAGSLSQAVARPRTAPAGASAGSTMVMGGPASAHDGTAAVVPPLRAVLSRAHDPIPAEGGGQRAPPRPFTYTADGGAAPVATHNFVRQTIPGRRGSLMLPNEPSALVEDILAREADPVAYSVKYFGVTQGEMGVLSRRQLLPSHDVHALLDETKQRNIAAVRSLHSVANGLAPPSKLEGTTSSQWRLDPLLLQAEEAERVRQDERNGLAVVERGAGSASDGGQGGGGSGVVGGGDESAPGGDGDGDDAVLRPGSVPGGGYPRPRSLSGGATDVWQTDVIPAQRETIAGPSYMSSSTRSAVRASSAGPVRRTRPGRLSPAQMRRPRAASSSGYPGGGGSRGSPPGRWQPGPGDGSVEFGAVAGDLDSFVSSHANESKRVSREPSTEPLMVAGSTMSSRVDGASGSSASGVVLEGDDDPTPGGGDDGGMRSSAASHSSGVGDPEALLRLEGSRDGAISAQGSVSITVPSVAALEATSPAHASAPVAADAPAPGTTTVTQTPFPALSADDGGTASRVPKVERAAAVAGDVDGSGASGGVAKPKTAITTRPSTATITRPSAMIAPEAATRGGGGASGGRGGAATAGGRRQHAPVGSGGIASSGTRAKSRAGNQGLAPAPTVAMAPSPSPSRPARGDEGDRPRPEKYDEWIIHAIPPKPALRARRKPARRDDDERSPRRPNTAPAHTRASVGSGEGISEAGLFPDAHGHGHDLSGVASDLRGGELDVMSAYMQPVDSAQPHSPVLAVQSRRAPISPPRYGPGAAAAMRGHGKVPVPKFGKHARSARTKVEAVASFKRAPAHGSSADGNGGDGSGELGDAIDRPMTSEVRVRVPHVDESDPVQEPPRDVLSTTSHERRGRPRSRATRSGSASSGASSEGSSEHAGADGLALIPGGGATQQGRAAGGRAAAVTYQTRYRQSGNGAYGGGPAGYGPPPGSRDFFATYYGGGGAGAGNNPYTGPAAAASQYTPYTQSGSMPAASLSALEPQGKYGRGQSHSAAELDEVRANRVKARQKHARGLRGAAGRHNPLNPRAGVTTVDSYDIGSSHLPPPRPRQRRLGFSASTGNVGYRSSTTSMRGGGGSSAANSSMESMGSAINSDFGNPFGEDPAVAGGLDAELYLKYIRLKSNMFNLRANAPWPGAAPPPTHPLLVPDAAEPEW